MRTRPKRVRKEMQKKAPNRRRSAYIKQKMDKIRQGVENLVLFFYFGGYIMFGFLIALLSGALMSVQGVFNTQVTKTSGIWVANAFVQFTALIVCLAAWLTTDRSSFTTLWKVEPKYMLLGGAIGAFITYTVIKGMEMLGPAKAVMIIVISQLIVAYLIELFGMFGVEKQPLEMRKIVGMGIAIAGIVIFKWT